MTITLCYLLEHWHRILYINFGRGKGYDKLVLRVRDRGRSLNMGQNEAATILQFSLALLIPTFITALRLRNHKLKDIAPT